jgi:hypothetical protein
MLAHFRQRGFEFRVTWKVSTDAEPTIVAALAGPFLFARYGAA